MSEKKNQVSENSLADHTKDRHILDKVTREIDIIIMDDDWFYNDLLKKTFLNFQELPEIQENYKLNITQIVEPQECMQKAMSIHDDGIPKIAFVDYYLGEGINGHQIIKLLIERNATIEIVLISQSEKIIGSKIAKIGSPHQNKIFKHDHVTELCVMMLNRFMKTIRIP